MINEVIKPNYLTSQFEMLIGPYAGKPAADIFSKKLERFCK